MLSVSQPSELAVQLPASLGLLCPHTGSLEQPGSETQEQLPADEGWEWVDKHPTLQENSAGLCVPQRPRGP